MAAAIIGDIVGAGTTDTVNIDPVNNANNTFTYGNTISGRRRDQHRVERQSGAHGTRRVQQQHRRADLARRRAGSAATAPSRKGPPARRRCNSPTTPRPAPSRPSTPTPSRLPASSRWCSRAPSRRAACEDFVKVFAASGTLANNITRRQRQRRHERRHASGRHECHGAIGAKRQQRRCGGDRDRAGCSIASLCGLAPRPHPERSSPSRTRSTRCSLSNTKASQAFVDTRSSMRMRPALPQASTRSRARCMRARSRRPTRTRSCRKAPSSTI